MGSPPVHSPFWPRASSHLPEGESIHLFISCPCVCVSICLSIHPFVCSCISPSVHPSIHPPTQSSMQPVQIGCLLWTRNHIKYWLGTQWWCLLLGTCHGVEHCGYTVAVVLLGTCRGGREEAPQGSHLPEPPLGVCGEGGLQDFVLSALIRYFCASVSSCTWASLFPFVSSLFFSLLPPSLFCFTGKSRKIKVF